MGRTYVHPTETPLTWVADLIPCVQLVYETIHAHCFGNWHSGNSCSAIDLFKNAAIISRMKTCFTSYLKGFFLVVESKQWLQRSVTRNNIILDVVVFLAFLNEKGSG